MGEYYQLFEAWQTGNADPKFWLIFWPALFLTSLMAYYLIENWAWLKERGRMNFVRRFNFFGKSRGEERILDNFVSVGRFKKYR